MRNDRRHYLMHLLVLAAILVTITLLITTKAYADEGAFILDDDQSPAIESVQGEAGVSVDQAEPSAPVSDDVPEPAPVGGADDGQGSFDDESPAIPDANEVEQPQADDSSDQSDDEMIDVADDDSATADDSATTDDSADEDMATEDDVAADSVDATDEDTADATDDDVADATDEEDADVQDAPVVEVVIAAEPKTALSTTAKAKSDSQKLTTAATATTLNGVDISGWNVGVDFSKLGDFVIIKATEWSPATGTYTRWTSGGNGSGNGSLSYTKQADAALKAGKLIGFYHFFVSPNYGGSTGKKASVVAQAKGFINAISVKDSNGKYKYLGKALLVLDWENTGYSSIESHVSWAKQWLDYVYEQTGVKPVIYMNYSCANNPKYDWSSVANAGYELWGARYFFKYYYEGGQGTKIKNFVSNPTMYADNDAYNRWGAWGKKPLMYQYTATCNLHGSNNYDANKFYGTKADWLNLAKGVHEISSTAAEAAKFLTNNAVYRFSPTKAATYVAYASSGNAILGSKNYRNGYWVVKNLGEGIYRFVNFGTGKALSFSPSSGKVSNSTNVTTKGSVDKWRLVKCTDGSYALVPNGFSSYRLDVSGGKIETLRTNLALCSGNGTVGQRFFFAKAGVLTSSYKASESGKPVNEGVYAIKSALGTSMVLDVRNGSTANAANVQLYKSTRSLARRFRLVYQGKGLYSIVCMKSGKLLEVAGGSTANKANVQQNASKLSLSQLWFFKRVDGSYKIYSARSGKCIDIAGGKSDNGTNVQIYTSSNTNAQKFTLVRDSVLDKAVASGKSVGDGYFTLISRASTKVMEIQGGSVANKANVSVYGSNGSLAQKFQMVYQGNGLYLIKNAKSQKLLSIAKNSSSAGANVIQDKSTGNRAQYWYITKNNGVYEIHSALSGKVLTVSGSNICMQRASSSAASKQQFKFKSVPLYESGTYTLKSSLGNYRISVRDGSTSRGGNVQIWATSTHLAQRWRFKYLGSGLYSIVNVNSGLAMEVAGGSKTSNANVQQGKYTGASHQKWSLAMTSAGAVIIRNAASGMVLDVAGGKAESGTNIRQRKASGSAAQSFTFARVS